MKCSKSFLKWFFCHWYNVFSAIDFLHPTNDPKTLNELNDVFISNRLTLIHTLMMTSSNGNIFALLAICVGNSPVTGEFPAQRPVTRSVDVFFDLRLNERLSKQWWGWWFETPSRPLWCHWNGIRLIPYMISGSFYSVKIPRLLFINMD